MKFSGAESEHHQVNGKEDDDQHFQPNHPPIVDVGIDDRVELVQLAESVLHALSPLVQIESFGRPQIDARQVPISKELADVGNLVVQLGDIDSKQAQRPSVTE